MFTSATEFGHRRGDLHSPASRHSFLPAFPYLLLSVWQASFSPSSRVGPMAHNFSEFSFTWECLYFPFVSLCYWQFFLLSSWKWRHVWCSWPWVRGAPSSTSPLPWRCALLALAVHYVTFLVFSFHKAVVGLLSLGFCGLPSVVLAQVPESVCKFMSAAKFRKFKAIVVQVFPQRCTFFSPSRTPMPKR